MRLFTLLFLILLWTSPAFAQEAVKFDEFVNIPCDDYLSRMDALFQEASKFTGSDRLHPSLRGKGYRLQSADKTVGVDAP